MSSLDLISEVDAAKQGLDAMRQTEIAAITEPINLPKIMASLLSDKVRTLQRDYRIEARMQVINYTMQLKSNRMWLTDKSGFLNNAKEDEDLLQEAFTKWNLSIG